MNFKLPISRHRYGDLPIHDIELIKIAMTVNHSSTLFSYCYRIKKTSSARMKSTWSFDNSSDKSFKIISNKN